MKELRVIAFTHKNFSLEEIGQFHIDPEKRTNVLVELKNKTGIEELMFLSTCNRVELIFTLSHYVCSGFTSKIIELLQPNWAKEQVENYTNSCERYNADEAVNHLLHVACSLDSVILGEREIVAQLRKSFEECTSGGLCGETLRMIVGQCVATSKLIFTKTELAQKPISVVSLAWQQFVNAGLSHNARILVIGAGQVIRNFCKFLTENNYQNITITNRTDSRANALAASFGVHSFPFENIQNYNLGFDALITCTSSELPIVDTLLYKRLLLNEQKKKLIIDLALPADVAAEVHQNFDVNYVGMNQIQIIASENIEHRKKALQECEIIIEQGKTMLAKNVQQRQIELAMQAIPEAVKNIRNTALGSVFAKDLELLDEQSREVIEKIMAYMEKKYISIPMKMAREVLMNEIVKN